MMQSRARAAPKSGNRATGASAQSVFDHIVGAIKAHRLAPGTRLIEESLGTLFGVSRTIVRQGIAKLAQAGLVDLRPNAGAQIATPDARRARELLEARRLVEVELVARAAERARPRDVARLRAHLGREAQARRRHAHGELVRLTGEFHLLLAEIAGNGVLARTLAQYETETCLSILAFDRTGASSCPPDEHAQIVDAIARRDRASAAKRMRAHLDHVFAGIRAGMDEAAPTALGMAVANPETDRSGKRRPKRAKRAAGPAPRSTRQPKRTRS